jgi:hypothetical protein
MRLSGRDKPGGVGWPQQRESDGERSATRVSFAVNLVGCWGASAEQGLFHAREQGSVRV